MIDSNEQPVSLVACKRVADFVQKEYFIRLQPEDPLIAAVVRDPDAGLRALLVAKNKTGSEQRITKQIVTIGGLVRSIVNAQADTPLAMTDRLIGKIETGFATFGAELGRRADASGRMPSDSWIRPHMDAPALLIEHNRSNPLRNGVRQKSTVSASQMRLNDLNHFFYGIAEQRHYAASFSPMERTMRLSKELDPANAVDMLVVGHEMKHVQLDTQKRARLNSPEMQGRYTSFYTGRRGERPRTDITEELFAYAWEVEAANLMVDDRLRSGAIADPTTLLRALNGRADQEGICEIILRLSRVYFPDGMRHGQPFPQRYTNALGQQYAQVYDVFVVDPVTLLARPWA